MIPFDIAEHNEIVMRRLAPVLEQQRHLLPHEVAARWRIDVDDVVVPVRCELADDLDEDGTLWLRVWLDGVGEDWFAVDARVVGIYDIGGELFIQEDPST